MAALSLNMMWFNRLDTGEGVGVYSAFGKSAETSMTGEVRMYAGGRRRSVTQEGQRQTYGVTVRYVTGATADLIEGWLGTPVQVRDTRGQVFVGTFYAVQRTELRDADRYDLSLAVNGITEGV